MKYTRKALEQQIFVVGLQIDIDQPSTAPKKIGAGWQQFFQLTPEIPNQTANAPVYAVYTNYKNTKSAETLLYKYFIGVQVPSLELVPKKFASISITTGNYAHYVVKGPMPISLISFWQEYWKTDLNYQRSFSLDYEVHYKEHVDVYIAIKE